MSRALVLIAAFCCGGCMTAADVASRQTTSAEELRRTCAARMYADRLGHGRSAPNWHLYDLCVKQRG